jgi:hypothetical protein
MKKLLLILALCLGPSMAFAQCNGVFGAHTLCGNNTNNPNIPGQFPVSAITGIVGGTNGQVQYNNAGVLGGLTNLQLTALVNPFTSVLSGAVPASGGGVITFLRADGTFAVPPTFGSAAPGYVPASGGGTINFLRADGTFSSPGGSFTATIPPEGRLTLTSGVPVTSTDVTGATTVFYTPGGSGGQFVPIWNGSAYVFTDTGGELSVVLGANWTTNTAYDWFVGLNASVPTLCSGPAWTNSGAGTSARGSGAGTTQLTLLKGIYVNTVSITCNTSNSTSFTCGANLCTYLGSFLTVAAGQAEDSQAKRYLYNQYNPSTRAMVRVDTTASWTYSTAAFRQANGAAANQLSYFAGNPGSSLWAFALCIPLNSTATLRLVYCGVGLNSTTVNSRTISNFSRIGDATVVTGNLYARYDGFTSLGLNNLVWLEQGAGVDTQTWFGLSAGLYQSGIEGAINQ